MAGNTSATGGYLVAPLPIPIGAGQGGAGQGGFGGDTAPEYGDELDAIFQRFLVGLTGLPGNMVRPRWQTVVPIQPEPTVNWCGVGVINITKDAYPVILEVPTSANDIGAGQGGAGIGGFGIGSTTNDGYIGMYIRHEAIEVLASFYGPQAQSYAAIAEDGMYVGQNNDMLKPFNMALTRGEPIRSVPDLVSQQWVKRYDLAFTVKRKVIRTQQILDILSAEIDIIADCPPIITEVVQVVPAP